MKWISRIGLLGVVPVCAFVLGFSGPEIRSKAVGGATATAADAKAPSEVFQGSYDFIRLNYDKKIDLANLKYAGMAGLTASLGDPHTMFFEPKSAEEFKKETSGTKNYAGVGARLQRHDLGVKITTAFTNSPAYQAGIRDRDVITGVNGKPIAGKEIDAIISQIKGPEGTTVKLTVLHPDGKTVVLDVKRARVIQPTVDANIIEGTNIGFVSVFGFSQVTGQQFDEGLTKIGAETLKGLVIDLRGNPGGLLDIARDMLSLFAPNKVVVTMKERSGAEQVTKTYYNLKRDISCPIVILVNQDSASASEIFAGAMRCYGLATLVGEHTYGKASVQNLIPFSDGGSLKVTIAHYFLPNGENISRKQDEEGTYISGGLKPDYEAKLSYSPKTQIGDPATDDQLKKAIEVINSKR